MGVQGRTFVPRHHDRDVQAGRVHGESVGTSGSGIQQFTMNVTGNGGYDPTQLPQPHVVDQQRSLGGQYHDVFLRRMNHHSTQRPVQFEFRQHSWAFKPLAPFHCPHVRVPTKAVVVVVVVGRGGTGTVTSVVGRLTMMVVSGGGAKSLAANLAKFVLHRRIAPNNLHLGVVFKSTRLSSNAVK